MDDAVEFTGVQAGQAEPVEPVGGFFSLGRVRIRILNPNSIFFHQKESLITNFSDLALFIKRIFSGEVKICNGELRIVEDFEDEFEDMEEDFLE